MEKIINKERLEKLLLTNWVSFLDNKKLLAFVLSTVKNQKFNVVISNKIPPKSVSVKLSKFELKEKGFVVWVEFTVPQQGDLVVGTSEIALNHDGTLSHIQTIGTLFILPTLP